MDMHTAATSSPSDIRTRLALDPAISRRDRRRRWLRWAAAVIVAALLGAALLRGRGGEPAVRYQTEQARRGALTVTVSATGSLEALTTVQVGTEISGVVDELNVDYNSAVRVGQVLARINTDKLAAQAQQARASLDSVKARRLQSQATVAEARAQLTRLEEVRQLSGGKVPSQTELDTQRAAVKRAEADDASNAASVVQAQASLAAIDTDLRRAYIRSPINGIVLDRAVDRGQTVAASFQTPTLFTLAEDLTRMKLSVDVDEADIGQVRVGQTATFRVDAYPDRTFSSRVSEVRSTATTSNGVVTYKTILSVDNSERLLRPSMTATANIVVTQVENALLVPNVAFRFTPPENTTADRGFSFLPRPPAVRTGLTTGEPARGQARVWVLPAGQAAPNGVDVTIGASDGTWTVVTSDNVQAGTPVVVNAATAS
jgi:HlyD family secretion protein